MYRRHKMCEREAKLDKEKYEGKFEQFKDQ